MSAAVLWLGQAQPRHGWASTALVSDGGINERAQLGGKIGVRSGLAVE